MTNVFSWQNCVSLCPASFCILRPNLPLIPSISCKQWQQVEENNRMGKTRELFKKIGDIKWTFHAQMDMIKDINSKDLADYGFSCSHVKMWELGHKEGWAPKNLKLWCWRRLLRVPWTTRRSNQSILKKINTVYSLEGLILKLKLQYFGRLMKRTDSLEKTLMSGKIEGRWRKGDRGWLDSITDSVDMNLSKLRMLVKDREAWSVAIHVVPRSQTGLNDWTTAKFPSYFHLLFISLDPNL